ncbi:insulinase family protein [Fructobacillus sp. CRL 2054]|uniref:EF-P 5-aminopentanol modification-associated protein YfmH n=1 Tax=Fructobacillus sp. CRL 2054 TaxID=2763007 RepID=UPI00238E4B14|nr:insulinase family protein [Fructobacillus sp. CRL 2054]
MTDSIKVFHTKDGLEVNLVQKKGYKQSVVSLAAKFGSLSDHFMNEKGDFEKIPAGTAHFLEHKLFDKKDGDALVQLANVGADGNAFTSNGLTAYYFSAYQNIQESLSILMHFVQEPYFTKASVERERGIIEEEIASYQDDPFTVLYQGLLTAAYPKTAMAEDIAGTAESLQEITPELLYRVHRAFYQPGNLVLTVVGDFDFDTVCEWVESIQEEVKVEPSLSQEGLPVGPINDRSKGNGRKEMAVSLPRMGLLKKLHLVPGMSTVEQVQLAEMVLDIVFGEQSDWYQDCYQSGLIGDDFDYEVTIVDSYAYMTFFTAGEELDKKEKLIRERLEKIEEVIAQSGNDFRLLQKGLIGESIQSQDRLSRQALDEDFLLYGYSLFDKMKLITQFKQSDLLAYCQVALEQGPLTRFIVKKSR